MSPALEPVIGFYGAKGKPSSKAPLTAGHAHVALQGGAHVAAVDDKVMPLRFAPDGLVNGAVDKLIALGRTQRRPQVSGIFLAETHIQRAGAGDADTVAAFAEVVGHRRDEAEPSPGFLHPRITRRAARAIIDVLKHEPLTQPRTYHR